MTLKCGELAVPSSSSSCPKKFIISDKKNIQEYKLNNDTYNDKNLKKSFKTLGSSCSCSPVHKACPVLSRLTSRLLKGTYCKFFFSFIGPVGHNI